MSGRTATQAVILAAGNGSRMAMKSTLPKPLVPVAGRALLDHILHWLCESGIQETQIVVGYRGDEIQRYPLHVPDGMRLEWIRNPSYELPNGISVLCAEGKVQSPFLLLMSDHLFDPSTLRDLLHLPKPDKGGVLATDRKVKQVFDIDDATKVATQGEHLHRIGKELPEYDSIDTGMFLLTEDVFPAIRESVSRGDASLSGGISVLASERAMRTWDIGQRRWMDIDTPEALAEAERLVQAGKLTVSVDGSSNGVRMPLVETCREEAV